MITTHTDETIDSLAASQRGRFTRVQVRERAPGEGNRLIASRLRSGRWRRLTSRVLCLPGSSMDWLGEIWTARLHVGDDVVVSHRSAARLHAFPGVPRCTPCLTIPAGSHRRYGAGRLFQRGDLAAGQLVRIDGLVVTSAARTLVDLTPGMPRSRLEAWVDHVTAERLATPDELAAVLRLCGRSGKPSLRTLSEVLAEYLPGSGSAKGTLERALANVVRIAGLPPGVAQFGHPPSSAHERNEESCDRAWMQSRLIVVCDGRTWHERLVAAPADIDRDASGQARGWHTLRYTYEELVGNPEAVALQLRAVYEQRMIGSLHDEDRAGYTCGPAPLADRFVSLLHSPIP